MQKFICFYFYKINMATGITGFSKPTKLFQLKMLSFMFMKEIEK